MESAMLRLLRTNKFLRQVTTNFRDPSATAGAPLPLFLHHLYPRPYSPSSTKSKNPPSLTLSFLTISCGLSDEAALSVAHRVRFKTLDNAMSVLALLKDYGFGQADIVRLVTRAPRVLTHHPEKTLKPKLDFYLEIGLAGAALAKVLASSPWSMLYGLESRLLPNANLLKSILGTNVNVVAALKSSPQLICRDLRKVVLPKIEALRAYGVADPVISMLLTTYGNSFLLRSARFEGVFEAVKGMGISSSLSVFAHALGVLALLPTKMWEQKLDHFKSLGWSQDQVLVAYARYPNIMRCSVEKIKKSMKFLEEKMGWAPDYVSRCPVLLSLSIEKRIIPRYTVLHLLKSKGLLKAGFSACQFLTVDKVFLRRHVIKYQDEAPEIIDAIKDLKPEWVAAA